MRVKDHHLARLFLFGLFLLGVINLVFKDLNTEDSFGFLPPCPIRTITDIPCPGCGMTRACLTFTQGEMRQAFHFHPLVFPLVGFAMLAGLFPKRTFKAWQKLSKRKQTWISGMALALVCAVWILRLLMHSVP